MKPQVLIAVPNGDGWLHKHVAMAVMKMLPDPRVKCRAIFPTNHPYENNLAHIMIDMLSGDEEWLVTIDTDNPPMNNPLDLVLLDQDVIGLPTPVWHNDKPGEGQHPIYWNAYDEVEDGFKAHPPGVGLEQVDAIGSGCMVIARRVLERLEHEQPFMRTWDDRGVVEVGTDLSFCRKARKAGFKVWTHWDYPCHHFNEIAVDEIQVAFARPEKD